MNYSEELFKALTAGVDGVFRTKSIDALVEVCRKARKEGYDAGFKNGNISDGTFDEKIKEAYENGANDAWECARKLTHPRYEGYKDSEKLEIFGYINSDDILVNLTASEVTARIKEHEEKQKAPAFKVGDRVRTIKEYDSAGAQLFPVGTIGEVIGLDDADFLVKAHTNGSGTPYLYYSADMLELAEDVFFVGDEVRYLTSGELGVVTAKDELNKQVEIVWTHGDVCPNLEMACCERTGRRFLEIAEVLKKMQEGKE